MEATVQTARELTAATTLYSVSNVTPKRQYMLGETVIALPVGGCRFLYLTQTEVNDLRALGFVIEESVVPTDDGA